ncbi:helix-turn-helix domain-containing protein [Streptomyces sp. NPDC127051]|uniref:helix-turn-helix domain-containing protein n=1 Tax=Streptomyces sp. NPDC127051 TaxID=3347119 RepID=UPI003650E090
MTELEHADDGAGGRLKPIGDDVSPEARLLAEELRTVYAGLGVSLRRCAAQCGYEPSAVSRYLSGKSVPPWAFVEKLMAMAARRLGQATAQEAVTHLRRVHRRAVPSGQATNRVQELQHLLEEAEQEVDGFRAREAVAVKLLQERQQQVTAIEIQLRSVEAARGLDREEHKVAMADRLREVEELRAEKLRLVRQVETLHQELDQAHQSVILADAKCEQLAHQLERAEVREADHVNSEGAEAAGAGSANDAPYLEVIAELNAKIRRLQDGSSARGTTERPPWHSEEFSLVRPYYRNILIPVDDSSGEETAPQDWDESDSSLPLLPSGVDVADLWVLDPLSGEYVLQLPPEGQAPS